MKRLHWQPKRWLRTRSREGVIGLILLASGLSFDLALLGPAQTRLEQLRQDMAASSLPANQPARAVSPGTIASRQLSSYYEQFPPQSSAPDWLNKIYQAAAAQNLQLTQGEYRVQPSETGKLVHYHVSIPVEGTYTQLRHFIANVLANVPNASLDQVSFERQKIEDSVIEAKVTFTLYLVAAT